MRQARKHAIHRWFAVASRLLLQTRAVTYLERAGVMVLVCALGACGGDEEAAPDAAVPDAAPVGQGSEASADLVINEIDPHGAPDWLEILNRSGDPIDLCDYLVTDALDRLDHYHPLGGALPPDPCEPSLLGAGDYLVVIADDGAEGAPFELGGGDELHLADWTGRAVDSLLYLHLDEDGRSLARAPDGEGLFFLAEPSRGEANP